MPSENEYLDSQSKSEIREGMRIDWDVPIKMADGIVLRGDVFRPMEDGQYPVIMAMGPYSKYLHFRDVYGEEYENMIKEFPEVTAGSSNKYTVYELFDPDKWVRDGYVCIRVDSRGAGRSPGVIDIWSAQEAKDLAACVEWAAAQSWSNGKVGLHGISYYAINQWQTAALQPEHLAAICVWEAAADFYRDVSHHGGILSNFFIEKWPPSLVYCVQHGKGTRGPRSPMNGRLVAGPETLEESELFANRNDFFKDCLERPLDTSEFYQSRMPDWSKVKVPLLSAANMGGQGLHSRGNFEGFVNAASEDKWLEVHGLEHWTEYYTDYGVELQKKFFNYFLKGEQNGWQEQPRVQLKVRRPGNKFTIRHEDEWPIARTQWTKFYLNPAQNTLDAQPQQAQGSVSYDGFGEGVTFLTPPLEEEVEITGPIASKIWVSSATEDADLFLVVRAFTPDMKEVVFRGSADARTPVANGWLRASHRKLNPERSLPYRPYHTHDEKQPLVPGEVYELDVEIWPTCTVIPAGYRLGLSVRGKDYMYPGGGSSKLSAYKDVDFSGDWPFFFQHNDPRDRPAAVFGGKVTLHTGPDRQAYVLLPIIPPK